jgi:hypothetical protein
MFKVFTSLILKVFCYFIRIIIFKLTSHTIGSTAGWNIYVYKIFDSIYLRKSSPTCALKKSRITTAFWASGRFNLFFTSKTYGTMILSTLLKWVFSVSPMIQSVSNVPVRRNIVFCIALVSFFPVNYLGR